MALNNVAKILDENRKGVFIETRRAILGLTPYQVRRNAYLVSKRRAVTRLRALQANHWPLRQLAQKLGYVGDGFPFMQGKSKMVTQDVDRAVEALYNEIGDAVGPSPRAAALARAAGYWPPIHYDEDMNLIPGSIPSEAKWVPALTQQERARIRLRILGLTLREYSMADIAMAIGESEKKVERARKMVGLRLERNRGVLLDLPYIKHGQEELVALIEEHTAPIALLEDIAAVDKLGTDYVALWDSLLEGAKRLRGDAPMVAEQAAA
jgi:hypothetical protein